MRRINVSIKNKIFFSLSLANTAVNLYFKCKLFFFTLFSSILKYFHIISKFKIRINNLNFFVYMSPNSDISIFDKIFIQKEYNINLDNNPRVIMDLGSNVGFSTLYFKSLFPKVTIYAFEPNPEIFKKLSLNCSQFKDIKAFSCAVSDRDRKGEFFIDTKSSLGSSSIRRSNENIRISVDFRGLDSIIEELNLTSIDLLKFDIEGSEYLVFKNSKKINIINNIIGEIHIDLGDFLLEDFLLMFKNDFYIETKKISKSRYIFRAKRK